MQASGFLYYGMEDVVYHLLKYTGYTHHLTFGFRIICKLP